MISKQIEKINEKRLFSFTLVVCTLLYSIYCFIIEPLYIASLYDVAYEGSLMPDILYYLGRIAEVLAMSVCYGVAALSIYFKGKLTFSGAFAAYLIVGAYKYAANLMVGWAFGDEVSLYLVDILFAVLYLALEMIPFAIASVVFNGIFKNHRERQKILVKAGKAEEVYPFRRLYDKRNPLTKAALVSVLVLLIPKLIGKVINDLIEIVEITNLPLMLVSYFSNIIFALLGYITVMAVFMLYFEKIAKK